MLGDIYIDTTKGVDSLKKYGFGVLTTTVGANSFANVLLATINGEYSVINSRYNGDENFSNKLYALRNFGALIEGSLNSIESATSNEHYSGVANAIAGAISGVVNKTNLLYKLSASINSKGDLGFGASFAYKLNVKEKKLEEEIKNLKNELKALNEKINRLINKKKI